MIKDSSNRIALLLMCLLLSHLNLIAREYHVAVYGNDNNSGTKDSPYRTISKAALIAMPGDTITVHAGTYRERIDPPRGGEDDSKRILYRAAPGEKVEVKGSEVIKNWERVNKGLWKITLPEKFFKNYNPYRDSVYGDWFFNRGWEHHTGEVFINGKSMYEKNSLGDLKNQIESNAELPDSAYAWYCESTGENVTIWAKFHSYNPNKELVELTTRPTCFYPTRAGIDYLTIRGFHFSQAATQWAAPTAEQVGLIATHWNKGWIIEDNVISNSKCAGITLGKDRETGHNVWSSNPARDGSVLYIEVIFKALRHGWSKPNIGSHIVRNNTIYNCEQAGIAGSLGGAFSIIESNHIHHIWTKRRFRGEEMAAIKLHGAIDVVIRKNRIHHAGRGLWLDWMAQGARVSGNLMYANDVHDIYIEVSHGPCVIDNNILGSPRSIYDRSQGSAFVHNLIFGKLHFRPDIFRFTPYHLAHSTDIAGFSVVFGGDNRYLNNIFAGVEDLSYGEQQGEYGTKVLEESKLSNMIEGNIYFNNARPHKEESNFLITQDATMFSIEETDGEVYLTTNLTQPFQQVLRVTTLRLGTTKITNLKYTDKNDESIDMDRDFFENVRKSEPTFPGPFDYSLVGHKKIKLW